MMDSEPAFTPVSEVGEFGLIERLQEILGTPDTPDLLCGIGDDAAVYRPTTDKVQVVTTDALIERIHFDRAFMPMRHLGAKAVGVNVSDIVAMNAEPRYLTISVGLPHTISVEMMGEFYQGIRDAAEAYGVNVLGGDTTASHHFIISVTAIGEGEEEAIVYRHGAQPGDQLYVTGDLGAAYAGLRLLMMERDQLQEEGEDYIPDLSQFKHAIQRQLAPVARLRAVRELKKAGVRPRAMIDISDGLSSEVQHLCRLSHCSATLVSTALPIHSTTRNIAALLNQDAETYALFGGEDYELLFAVSPEDVEKIPSEGFTRIGELTDSDEPTHIQTPQGQLIPLQGKGYQHFGGSGAVE